MAEPAYEHDGRLCTRADFYAIACDPRRSVAVEACAGAGKTWMLVSRIVRALLAGTRPEEILAITFTRKAAGEMRARLQQWLLEFSRPWPADTARGRAAETEAQWQQRLQQELLQRGVPPDAAPGLRGALTGLYARVLESGEAVQIRTFHSWFIALLRGAPLAVLQQLGLPLEYELVPEAEREIAEVWRPFLHAVDADAALRADYAALVAAVGRTNLHKALEAALKRRMDFVFADGAGAVDGAVAPFAQQFPQFAGLDDPADALLASAAGRALLGEAAEALLPLARTCADAGRALAAAVEARDWGGVVAALFTGTGTPRALARGKTPPVVRSAQDAVAAVLAARAQHEAWLYHQRMARLVRALIAAFGDLKRARGWVDMDDVERAALTLLADHELSAWVQEKLDLRVRQLLVDEFQDTNALQWRALRAWLAGYAGAGGGPEAPRVFIVGDPKQSIYRFRRADPRLFAAAQDFIAQALDGARLACDHTWRNAPQVLATVNDVMARAQQAGQFTGFRAHTTESTAAGQVGALPMVPRPPRPPRATEDEGAPLAWRDSLACPREEPDETLRTLECRQVARWIAARVAAGAAPGDIMVLARKREPLAVLQLELRAAGVPAAYDERQKLIDLPVAKDVLALADALLSPGNDLALAQALKSPFFGVGDAGLAAIARAAARDDGTRAAWIDVLPEVDWGAAGMAAPALHARLLRYRDWLLRLPPHDALQAILADTDARARFAAAAPAADRTYVLRQLDAVLGSALDVDGGRFLSAYRWLHALRRGLIPAPRSEAHDAVCLLTVHGAKGLEADDVVLLDAAVAAGGRRGEPAMLVDWPAEAAAPRRLVFLARDSAPPADAQALLDAEQQAQAREELNALYVALTRARQRLVLAAFEPGKQAADSWWLRVGADQGRVDAIPAPAAAASPTAAAAPAFSMPALPPPGAPFDLPAPVPAPDDASARIGQAMHWLLEHAAEAAGGWQAQREGALRQRFGLDRAQAQRAVAMARAIFHGAGAWAWSGEAGRCAFSEVELAHGGKPLRMDRLVLCAGTAGATETWWILDYKSAQRPEVDAALQAQLRGYRAALEAIRPGVRVRAAFLSADGRVVPVD